MTASNHLDKRQSQALSLPREHDAWLVYLPLLTTGVYYSLPTDTRVNPWITFGPQIVAYMAMAVWLLRNQRPGARLGLSPASIVPGLRLGSGVGIALGLLNLLVILWVIPRLGGDIAFLQDTPHARAPFWIMFPFGIAIIAILVEVNFRGFQLGRLASLFGSSPWAQIAAVTVSAVSFAWDPFMVHVFGALHWIALWDGVVWGFLFLRTRSLYATMAAHTVEVLILYGALKLWFA